MVANQEIEYAPQCGDLTVESFVFQTNNVVGNFNYLQNIPAYKQIFKFLMNYPLKKTFTKCPSVIYQNFLREFWCTAIAYDPNPPADETRKRKESLRLCQNLNPRHRALRLLEHCPEIELTAHMIAINNQKDSVSLLPCSGKKKKVKSHTMTPTLSKSHGLEASRAFSKKRQKHTSKKTPTDDQVTPPTEPTEGSDTITDLKDSGGNVQPVNKGFPSMVFDKGMVKTTSLPEGPRGDKDLEGLKPPADMEPLTNHVVDPLGTDTSFEVEPDYKTLQLKTFVDVQALLISDDELLQESDDEDVFKSLENIDEDTQVDEEEHQSPPPKKEHPETSHAQESNSDSSCPDALRKYDNILPLTERQLVKASIEGYYEENVDHRDQTDKLIQATIDCLDKNSTERDDLLKALNGVTETLEVVQEAVKDDPALNRKARHFRYKINDGIYLQCLQRLAFFAPSSSVPATLAITVAPACVKGENLANTIDEEPPSYTEGEHVAMEDDTKKPEEGKGIATNQQLKVKAKIVKASTVVREDPDEPIMVPYMINGNMYHLTNDEINAHMEKEDKIKKAAEEAKMFEITKTKVIIVVQEEVEKIGIDPKTVVSAQVDEKFKKAQDADHQVLKRKHSQKVKRLMELNKKRVERYERLKKIPKELEIQSVLPAPIPEQAPSQTSRRKRKHMELEPEIKVHGLECNRSLPEGVLFVNYMVIQELVYEIFFTDVFGDQAFQRWNDIHKVREDSLVSYLVMASMIKTPENARFCLKLKKLIAEHPDQEKLQAKKVKLESVGYKLD
ncbi:hypothetical protein Tco_0266111 [Tanacetum coccineum]